MFGLGKVSVLRRFGDVLVLMSLSHMKQIETILVKVSYCFRVILYDTVN